jgi:hypothetical protein
MCLNGCNDWENWQVQFEALARSENVWNIVTSSARAKPMPEEPMLPEINTSLVIYGMVIRSQTVSKTSKCKYTGPITQSPTYINYQLRWQVYQTHLKIIFGRKQVNSECEGVDEEDDISSLSKDLLQTFRIPQRLV